MSKQTHYMAPDKDCMGNSQPGYYRCFMTCSDGRTVIGTGSNETLAELRAQVQLDAHEEFLRTSPSEQLRRLVAGDLCDSDQKAAICIIAKIILDRI